MRRGTALLLISWNLKTILALEYHHEQQAQHVTALWRHARKGLRPHQDRTAKKHVEVEVGVHNEHLFNMTTPLEDMVSEYTGVIGVGTAADGGPQFKARVVFDTGSTNLWVASVLCREFPCNGKSELFYDPSKSRTEAPWKGTSARGDIDIMFGTGELKGPLHVDTYRVGPMALPEQPFAMIREMNGDVFSAFPFEGILGLAFPSLSFAGIEPFFERVIKSKLLENNEFAFFLNKDSTRPSAILWGGVDKALYEGPIVMFPVVKPHYWALELVDFKIDGKSMLQQNTERKTLLRDSGKTEDPRYVIVDSGTTYYTAPTGLYGTIRNRLPTADCATASSYPMITYVLRSPQNELFELKVSQEMYMVEHDSGFCKPAFMKLDVKKQFGPAMILGEVFMRYFFTVFSRGSGALSEAKIGFAKAKREAEPYVDKAELLHASAGLYQQKQSNDTKAARSLARKHQGSFL